MIKPLKMKSDKGRANQLFSEQIRKRGFQISDLLQGRKISPHLQELLTYSTDFNFPNKLSQDRLEKLLSHACRTTGFYKSYSGTVELKKFPVIEKKTIKDNYDAFISTAYRRKTLATTTTSGSYGTPMLFYRTPEKKARHFAEIIAFNSLAGYELGMKHAYCTVFKKSPIKVLLQNEVQLFTGKMDKIWLENSRHILKNDNIRFMVGYPSTLGVLADYCMSKDDHAGCFKLVGIVMTGETFDNSSREKVQHLFGCPVLSRYATLETGVLAHECGFGGMHHLNLASYQVELLDLNEDNPVKVGETGRVVVTDYYSHAMPLIRYDTGDLAVLGINCSCGCKNHLFERIEGRRLETICNDRSEKVSPLKIINIISRTLTGIEQFQFIQCDRNRYNLKLCVQKNFAYDQIDLIIFALKELLGVRSNISVDYVTFIPPRPSGKRPIIVNKYILQDLNID